MTDLDSTAPHGGSGSASPPGASPNALGAPSMRALIENVERAIYGKREAVTLAVCGLLAEGHILLEDVPGTGKTTLARALARSVDASFRRIQFTSDLLPADVLGGSMPAARDGALEFQAGPIFGNIVLADELNRTTPRTQSALLECMNEARATVEGVTRDLPRPFLVIATQNPIDFEGTYPLPESQLDRFLMRIRMGYPAQEHERRILTGQSSRCGVDELEPVLSAAEVVAAIAKVPDVRVDDALVQYILDVVEATRTSGRFLLGASPRAASGLYRAAQALALIEGRAYVIPDDVKRLVLPVLGHRIVPIALNGNSGLDGEEVLAELLESIPIPT